MWSASGFQSALNKGHASQCSGHAVANEFTKLFKDSFLKFEINDIHRGHFAGHRFDLRIAELLHQLRSEFRADNNEKRSKLLRFRHCFIVDRCHGLAFVFIGEPFAQCGAHVFWFLANQRIEKLGRYLELLRGRQEGVFFIVNSRQRGLWQR